MKKQFKNIVLFIVLLLFTYGTASADVQYENINRISGNNRYETAVLLSKTEYQESKTVVLANDEVISDAICATQLGHRLNVPLLLTSHEELPVETRDEIKRLGTEKLIIIGGPESINDKQFTDLGLEIERIAGEDRFKTSELVLEKLLIDDCDGLVVVSGHNFQNIISANQVSKATGMPLLLIDDSLPLKYYNCELHQIGELDLELETASKITGMDFYDISAKCLYTYNIEDTGLTISSGENLGDSILAASLNTNTLMTNKNYVNRYAVEHIENYNYPWINIVGGVETIEDSVIHQLYGMDRRNLENATLPEKLPTNHEGDIMVLMYHDLNYFNDWYIRTEGAIKADIINLYNRGYLPISIEEYYFGNINIEEGYTPYVLTFDDGTDSKIRFDTKGKVSRNCVYSLLMELEEKLPKFKSKAAIFINNEFPFGQKEHIGEKLKMLIDSGIIVGNHTLNHANLYENPELIEREIGLQKKNLESYIGSDYKVDIFSIPFSVGFENQREYDRLRSGSYDGIDYHNRIILGGVPNPALAPGKFHTDKYIVPRISVPGSAPGRMFYDYLEMYDKYPEKRYVK